MKLFLDLDGVLADMHGFYHTSFGIRPTWEMKNFWEPVKQHGSFFRDMPKLHDADELFEGVKHLQPTILTGSPYSIPDVEQQKRAWIAEHFGSVPVICCKSRDKRLHGKPGDILIDDWEKFQPLWQEMGGVFILHTSAKSSLEALCAALSPK